jgi:hypothetical protein
MLVSEGGVFEARVLLAVLAVSLEFNNFDLSLVVRWVSVGVFPLAHAGVCTLTSSSAAWASRGHSLQATTSRMDKSF